MRYPLQSQNGSSQGQNLALTVLFVPNSLGDSAEGQPGACRLPAVSWGRRRMVGRQRDAPMVTKSGYLHKRSFKGHKVPASQPSPPSALAPSPSYPLSHHSSTLLTRQFLSPSSCPAELERLRLAWILAQRATSRTRERQGWAGQRRC